MDILLQGLKSSFVFENLKDERVDLFFSLIDYLLILLIALIYSIKFHHILINLGEIGVVFVEESAVNVRIPFHLDIIIKIDIIGIRQKELDMVHITHYRASLVSKKVKLSIQVKVSQYQSVNLI